MGDRASVAEQHRRFVRYLKPIEQERLNAPIGQNFRELLIAAMLCAVPLFRIGISDDHCYASLE